MAIRYIMAPVTFSIEPVKEIEFKIQRPRPVLFEIGPMLITQGGAPSHVVYDGDYIVTPRVWEQTLETDDKYMSNNVTVLEIPAAYVENTTGGYTVSIG